MVLLIAIMGVGERESHFIAMVSFHDLHMKIKEARVGYDARKSEGCESLRIKCVRKLEARKFHEIR